MSEGRLERLDEEPGTGAELRARRLTMLIEVHYTPLFIKIPPIKLIGQIVNSGSLSYVWVDGLDRNDPILIPALNAPGPRHLGTLDSYVRANEASVHEIVDCAMSRDLNLSSLLVVRAVEAMRLDMAGPDRAIDAALGWSRMLLEFDEMERQAFNDAFNDAFNEAAEEAQLEEQADELKQSWSTTHG